MVAFQSVGVSLLFVMGLFPAIWTRRWLILPVYILRTMANNCCYAIIRSLLMDYVPKVGLPAATRVGVSRKCGSVLGYYISCAKFNRPSWHATLSLRSDRTH